MIKSYLAFKTVTFEVLLTHIQCGIDVDMDKFMQQEVLMQIYHDFNYNKYLDDLQSDHTLYYKHNADEWMQKEILK